MENTSRVSMAALSNPLDISHEEARLRHADRATPHTAFHVMPSDTVHDHFVERDGLCFAGTHLLIDLWQASNLDDIEVVETALRDAVVAAGRRRFLRWTFIASRRAAGSRAWPCLRRATSQSTHGRNAPTLPSTYSCAEMLIRIKPSVCSGTPFAPDVDRLGAQARSNTMNAFQEKLYEHHSQVFTMDADLYRARTKFQDVLIFENRLFGRVLVLMASCS
jgi:hypothetical protein